MNIKNISAIVSSIVLITAAGAAMAEQPYPGDAKFVSTKTRAQVIAELVQARADGEVIGYDGYPRMPVVSKSTLTRAQVIQELKDDRQARAAGGTAATSYLR